MAPLLQDYKFLITAKKLDNFTFNTVTFSYPIFRALVNHFRNIWEIHAKIGVPKWKYRQVQATNRWMLPDLSVVVLDQYNENLHQIINTANWSLKQKIYILKYICLYILRFILLFTSSLPFYNFLQVIGVVIGVGWVRNLPPKLGKGTGAPGLDFWYFPEFPGLRR